MKKKNETIEQLEEDLMFKVLKDCKEDQLHYAFCHGMRGVFDYLMKNPECNNPLRMFEYAKSIADEVLQ